MHTQETIVLNHLKKVGSITGIEAAAIHKIRSLSRRITTLRGRGYEISKKQSKDVTGQRYVRYIYVDNNAAVEVQLTLKDI